MSSSLVYFSFATLTTLGYGDVTAVHTAARSLALLEALTGQLFPAVLIARLVAMEVIHYQEKLDRDHK
jgi:voltage-gated potassium channel Kch